MFLGKGAIGMLKQCDTIFRTGKDERVQRAFKRAVLINAAGVVGVVKKCAHMLAAARDRGDGAVGFQP